jgi:tRNA pseudouridine38-40 synthase
MANGGGRALVRTSLVPGTTRWLVRFGYDGLLFRGWARQPGSRTVEGELLQGIVRHGITSSAPRAHLEVASRTDRGVSALGNVLALSTTHPGPILLRALNGISPELFFTAATPLPEGFRVRSAVRRVYRYFEPAKGRELSRWQTTARLFAGTIDVRSFGRGLSSGTPVWRTVESVRVERRDDLFLVEVRAPSFVWGMVRKIVGALRAVDRGQLTTARLEAALGGRERLTLPLAEPERLLLWEVELPIPWTFCWNGPNRHQTRWWVSAREALAVRSHLVEAISRGLGPDPV